MAVSARKANTRLKPKRIHKTEHHHYWPYIPVLIMTLVIFAISLLRPLSKYGVLAYATEMSSQSLLESTNQRRLSNNVKQLELNPKLSAAAQSKADDMVNRDYWSHKTPDGDEPWTFLSGAGYKYSRAGENLAFGFSGSDGVVNGWMNSPTHKANLLDGSFTEVGFGYANSTNFNGAGPETVVVAFYARPLLSLPPSPEQTAGSSVANTENALTSEPKTLAVSRLAIMGEQASGGLLFALGLMTGSALAVLLLKHMAALRHVIKGGRKFVLHHPFLDTALVSLVLIGCFLLQTSGFIR